MNLLKVLVVALLKLARGLEVCHTRNLPDASLTFCHIQREIATLCLWIFVIPQSLLHEISFQEICLHFDRVFNLVLNIKSSNVILEGQVMFPKSDSSDFEELYSSILESVIYRECKSFHLFLKSALQMSLASETECSMKITL